MITLKEILDGSKDREMEIREEIKKINELLKLLPTTNSNYDIWMNKKRELEARLGKKESLKEAYARTPDEMAQFLYKKKYADLTSEQKKEVDIELDDLMRELGESCKKKESYSIIRVDGADIPVEVDPEGKTAKDMKGNRYLKLDGKWVMEKLKENLTVMQGSPTDYKVGSRVRIVGGLYSNSFGKITALGDKDMTIAIEPSGEKVKVLPAQIAMAESFSKKLSLLKEAMKRYDANKEGISKETEKWIFKEAVIGQKIIVGNFDSDYPAIVTGVDNGKVTTAQVKMYGVTKEVIIDNDKWWVAKEALKEANPISDYDDKELNDKAQDLFGKGFQFLSDAERKQVLDSFKENFKERGNWWKQYEDGILPKYGSDKQVDSERDDESSDKFNKKYNELSKFQQKEIDDFIWEASTRSESIKKEVLCKCGQDAETVNGRPYCNTCQKYLDESLKEMANVNKIKLTGAWNIPKIVSKVQDLAVSYGTHFADGVIDTKGLLDRELNGLMGDLKGMGLTYQTESLKESLRTCDFCGKQYDSAVKQSNYPYCSKVCEDKDNVGVGTHDEVLKESTDREVEAQKMFGKAYKDLTPAEKEKVDEANIVSLALGIESLKEYAQYSEIPADLKNLDSKYYSDNKTEDELLKMIRTDLPALSKYSDSEIKSAINIFRSD